MREKSDFHENLSQDHDVKGASDRAFGLTVGAVLVLIAAVRWALGGIGWPEIALAAGGLGLIILGGMAHGVLSPMNRAWTGLSLVLFKVVNPLIMGLIFITTVTPVGIVMKLAGKDPLRLKFEPDARSYWIERKPPGPAPETMKQQF